MGKNNNKINGNLNRRSLLRGLGTTAVAMAGMSGTAAANSTNAIDVARNRFADRDERERAFREHGQDLLEELSRRSLLESASVSELPLDTYVANERLFEDESEDGTSVTVLTSKDDVQTALLMSVKNTPTHTIRFYVKPETDESYALVRSKTDGEEFAIDPSMDESRLEASMTCDDTHFCGDRCKELAANCVYGDVELWVTHYMSCYASYDRCHCYETGETECGAKSCWETCTV